MEDLLNEFVNTHRYLTIEQITALTEFAAWLDVNLFEEETDEEWDDEGFPDEMNDWEEDEEDYE